MTQSGPAYVGSFSGPSISGAPEPATWTMMLFGLLGLGSASRVRRLGRVGRF